MSTYIRVIAAIALIAFGATAFAYQGAQFAKAGRELTIGSPVVFGTIALICGIGLLLIDKQDFRGVPRSDARRGRKP